jgi:uncharacterized protein YicC (UPF0701 family)
MGGSLEFSRLLAMRITYGKFRLAEELEKLLERGISRDDVIKLMNGVIEYVRKETAPHDFSTFLKLERFIESMAVYSLINRMVDYIDPERAVIKALDDIIASILHRILYEYMELLREEEEYMRKIINERIDKYVSLLKEYAERYPSETAHGLANFVDRVHEVVEMVKEDIKKYGHPIG